MQPASMDATNLYGFLASLMSCKVVNGSDTDAKVKNASSPGHEGTVCLQDLMASGLSDFE